LKGALAIFAKTPGLSPVKTRLAAEIGEEAAREFYELSVACVAMLAKDLKDRGFHPHWALAERQAPDLERWQGLPALWTGEGTLGKRLAVMGETLSDREVAVGFLGTDSPQLDITCLITAWEKTETHDVVVIPAEDGGFVFLASAEPVPRKVWETVAYSRHDTLDQLEEALVGSGRKLLRLAPEQDVDLVGDLWSLRLRLEGLPGIMPAQSELLDWLKAKGF